LLRSELAAEPDRLRQALAGLRRYQEAERRYAPAVRATVASAGPATLRDCGGAGPPLVLIPSLINPPHVLDLSPGRSLAGYLAETSGHRVLLVNWGTPGPDDAALGLAGHVEERLLPLVDALGEPAALIGYCLGGTLALGLAALRAPRALGLIATPWRFDGFGPAVHEQIDGIWEAAAPLAERLGYLPMEVLQSGFWQMDRRRTVTKFEKLATLDPDGAEFAQFVALEDWANGGAPLSFAAARELMDDLFASDVTGRGRWQVGGRPVRPDSLGCPIVDIASTTDRIVPAATALGAGQRVALAEGHVGMVVGRRARASLWEPLGRWLVEPGSSW
jgi:polyhydroxyalkanoate synthase subunit PhaC